MLPVTAPNDRSGLLQRVRNSLRNLAPAVFPERASLRYP